MEPPRELRTERVLLRRWRAEDLEPFAALNADARVMRHFPAPLSRDQSAELADRIAAGFAQHGFGLWALELPGVAAFAGCVGLSVPTFQAAFTPCVEIGWRLAAEHWGRGYASEAARRVLRCAEEDLRLAEVLAFTAAVNMPSVRVMQRIGMRHDPAEDFDHPLAPATSPLRRHVLYRWRPGAPPP